MIATCPNCETSFNINENLVKAGGSKLRCANCRHVFMMYRPGEEPAREKTAEPETPHSAPVSEKDVPAPDQPAPDQPVDQPAPDEPATGDQVAAASPDYPPQAIRRPPPSSPPAGDEYPRESTITMVDFAQDVFEHVGEITERYEELGSIGKGGMGEVLLAKDTQLLRKVAIKVLKDDSNKAALSYFLREAQITAQLDHPNIVPLYNVKPPDEKEKHVSFVMKLVKGKTLFDIIARARELFSEDPKAELPPEVSLETRLEYFLKACEGITYAHRKQVIHRDLKPANIMVGDYGEVYVMDWGIAKMMQGDYDDNLTNTMASTKIFTGDIQQAGREMSVAQPEGVVGTLSYMSPEQANADPEVGPSSDIFSLGAVLYELVTLRPARIGDSKQKFEWAKGGFLNRMIHLIPEKKIPKELQNIIYKSTEIEPENRYETVNEMASDVRRFLRDDEVSVHPDNPMRKMWRWMNRHWQVSAIALLSFLILGLVVTIHSLNRERAALQAAQFRETRMSHLQAEISAQAHYIDSHFLRLEDLVHNIANNAIYLIEKGPLNEESFYWIEDFKNPENAPPDLEYAELYQRDVSIDYPVVKVVTGVERWMVKELMQKLAPLRHHFKQMILSSRGNMAPLSEEEARRLMTKYGLPIRWAYIGLEAGVMYSYPGKGTYPEEYDPRKRPWYKMGKGSNTVKCDSPYLDLQGQGMVLPCAAPLYDTKDQFVGVVGMDVTFTDIIRDNLTRKNAKEQGVIESYLINGEGEVVVRSSQSAQDMIKAAGNNASKDLKPFHVPEVVKLIKKSESGGLVEIKEAGKSKIYVFSRMPSINFYYVEEVETAVILNR